VSSARPTLVERLQQQVTKLEREAAFLRSVDNSMKRQLAGALNENADLKKTNASQATTLNDLRQQLGRRGLELELMRAELEAERASRPVAPAAAVADPKASGTTVTRFGQLEID
jgi:chromosome segregation ATPase